MINLYFSIPIMLASSLLFAKLISHKKPILLLLAAFFITTNLFAQKTTPIDTIKPGNGSVKQQLKEIKDAKKTIKDSTGGTEPKKTPLIDTTIQNKYGDLLNDDIKYNKRYPLWKPAVEVIGVNVALNLVDRYLLNLEFSKSDIHSWGRNLRAGPPWGDGWIWDHDRFGNNFLSHPETGAFYFNAARSQGYNFWQSTPFVFAGSYSWKIFGENGKPEREDLVNTTFGGMFLGEISYRLSSNILDDRAVGGNRVFREVMAGLVDPVRGLNRLLQGKSFRHTTTEVYQKEPLNITLFGGVHIINQDAHPNNPTNSALSGNEKGSNEAMVNLQLDYGNPFEEVYRKPYDFFKLRTEFSFGSGRKLIDNITGYGILVGDNAHLGKVAILYGVFQYFDYFDNKTFELGASSFGGGLFTKYAFSKNVNLYTSAHLALIPLAGNSTRFGPDTSQVRDYTYNDGISAKFESTLSLGKYATVAVQYNYFFLHTYNGPAGDNYISLLKPRVTVQIVKNISLGVEHFIYFDDRNLKNFAPIHSVRTEEKIFLSWFLEDPQRKGRYN
ncbi:MAG: hypothetical protein NVSMB24_04440 [Mucilaginibacter sp.]